jgi:hypothetical protein
MLNHAKNEVWLEVNSPVFSLFAYKPEHLEILVALSIGNYFVYVSKYFRVRYFKPLVYKEDHERARLCRRLRWAKRVILQRFTPTPQWGLTVMIYNNIHADELWVFSLLSTPEG